MMQTSFPPDWRFEFPKCTIEPNIGEMLKYQEKTVSIFGKLDILRKVNQLEDEIELLKTQLKSKEKIQGAIPKDLSDAEAQSEIESFLKVKKKEGTKTVNILDLMQEFNLPPNQIEKIMTKLKSKGVESIHG